MYLKNSLVENILCFIHRLKLLGVEISFCWVSGHCGITQNTEVDEAIEKTSQLPIEQYIVASDLLSVMKHILLS